MLLVFLGPPGSGKGTQAKKLCVQRQWLHLSTGDLLRAEINSQSDLGREIKTLLDSGQFVNDQLMVRLVDDCLSKHRHKNAVLDGFPRTLAQAELFHQSIGKWVDGVINFNIDSAKLIERLTHRFSCTSCGALYNDLSKPTKVLGTCDVCGGREFSRRADDKADVIQERLDVYHSQTKPLVDYFAEKNILHSLQADLDINTIQEKLHDLVEGLCKHSQYN